LRISSAGCSAHWAIFIGFVDGGRLSRLDERFLNDFDKDGWQPSNSGAGQENASMPGIASPSPDASRKAMS